MSSFVHYKFKFQKDDKRINFDGTGISVSDIKQEILSQNSLDPSTVDIVIYDASGKEYNDESFIVPRSTSVVAKRMPMKQGSRRPPMPSGSSGTSAVSGEPVNMSQPAYLRGRQFMSKRFDGKDESQKAQSTSATTSAAPSTSQGATSEEAAAMAAMFRAQTDVWEETQEKMSHATPIYSGTRGTGRGGRPFTPRPAWQQSDRPLPPSYVCYRCGGKGHWIYDCPTNNDKDFDNRPRIKRTTGIPRSFLKSVDSPDANAGSGIMVTPEGGFVVAQPDLASWQKQVSRTKGLTPADIRERPVPDTSMACPIDNKLFKDVVKTPCCGTRYCEECIHSYLLDHDFICPKCSKKIHSLDHLSADKPMRTRVGDYIDKIIKENAEAEAAALKASETEDKEKKSSKEATPDGDDAKNDEVQFDQQPGSNFDLSQLMNETIPQLQAQVQQLSVMIQNTKLPPHVRQSTMNQYQQTQMQLQQAQTFVAFANELSAAAAAAQQNAENMEQQQQQLQQLQQNFQEPQMPQLQWNNNQFVPQPPAGLESAYQRLPVNNRRRNVKRERPSDFLEIGTGEPTSKMPKFWE